MTEKQQTFLITITVIEGRHYIWDNMNSAVIIKVGNKKKTTAVKKNSDSPFYNEINSTYDKLLEKNIVITVIQPRTFCRKRKILGAVKMDIATVMNQKTSQFYHKWAVLASPKADVASGPTGYLKLDIAILSRGQTPKLPLHILNDEIEGNLLAPMGFVNERQRTRFTFDIYRCEHLHTKPTQFVDFGPSKQNSAVMDARPSTYVAIIFAGSTVSTTVRKHTQDPIFNERLTITDLFPPLCQRVKIEICLDGMKKSPLSVHYLNLKHISNDTVDGFLPTFGPTYIYLYSKQILEGYSGTILMSMRTDFVDNTIGASAAQKANNQQGLSPLQEEQIFSFEDIFLFATIFEAHCIPKKYHDKLISFRITFGNITSETEIEGAVGDGHPSNVTVAQKPLKTGRHFYYLNYAEEKPCLRIKSRWPDFRKRMYHSNMLEKITKALKSRLEEIEQMFIKQNPNYAQTIEEGLKEATDFLYTSARKYVDILATSYDFDYGSILDKERVTICLKTMNGILDKIPYLQANKSKKFVYRHLEDFQMRIASLIEDAQPCWPDVFLWMTCANKKVAYLRIPAREIVFSQIEEEMGELCGKIRPMLFLVNEKNTIICKVDVLMWLGLEKQKEECINILPRGFKYEGRLLIAEEKHLFEGKAYLFEGEVIPGFDESGLVDPFVQVYLGKECKETQVKKNVLVPLWDQTLTFHNVYLYGSKEHIRQNPPNILVQMYDEDPMSMEFIGRNNVTPDILFLDELPANNLEKSEKTDDVNKTKLAYYSLYSQGESFGRILAAFRLNEITQPTKVPEDDHIVAIPTYLKPHLETYKIEVMFWGVRHLKKVNLIRINRPKISFFCGNKSIDSHVIENAKKFSNFSNYINSIEVSLPDQNEYPEAFQFKLFDSRKFGVYVFAGVSISDTTAYLFTPMSAETRTNLLSGIQYQSSSLIMHSVTSSEVFLDNWEKALIKTDENKESESTRRRCWKLFLKLIKSIFNKERCKRKFKVSKSEYSLLSLEDQEEEEGDLDWWTKFYASSEGTYSTERKDQISSSQRNKLKIYASELENQPEFRGFSDLLTTFEIIKGKRTGDEVLDEHLTTAIFKGSVKIYKWPPEDGGLDKYVTPHGGLVKDGVFSHYPANTSVHYVLRIYCIRGINLRPKDPNGKSDPYLQIQIGNKLVSDRLHYIPKDINPIFGRCFEFQLSFPEYTLAIIRVFDYDMTSADDLIGETKIDLENRFYTKHRAWCGIAESYHTSGYCQWRDQKKPTDILRHICKKWGLEQPEYRETSVCINSKEFFATQFRSSDDLDFDREVLALETLQRWQEMPVVGFKIVPEHIETRSLYIPDKPGIEQGKLQLWIDIFPRLDYPVPEKVNITPRKPVSYELRVIIWNTEDVTLDDDDFFTGEKKSDIYVKGWLDEPCNSQYTDVHYRSLTGEGNFNWRFVFKFDYLSTENKLVIRKKESVFSKDDNEIKIPCILNMTVWDNDTFSKDDFLGALSLELSRMPRGARNSKKCNLSILEPTAKKINLFKIRRTKGWWPFRATDKETQQPMLGGKLEAELEILTKEEAEINPAGMGRQGPEALPPPKRPDTSYSWFRNPLKSCKYVVCTTWRWKIIKGCLFIFLVFFVVLAVYTLPSATVKKFMNVINMILHIFRHGDRIQRRHQHDYGKFRRGHFDEEIPTYARNRRNYFREFHVSNLFKGSKCVYCKSDRARDCKICFVLFVLILLAFVITMILYYEGYITRFDPNCSKKQTF